MSEASRSDVPATPSHCPWCSAALADAAVRCPACGAVLHGDDRAGIPGVTEVDPNAIRRGPLPLATPSLGSLLMGGVDTERPSAAELEAIAAPDDAVRREMLRLEFEARRAELEHEAHALAAELRAEDALKRAGITGRAAYAPMPLVSPANVDAAATAEPLEPTEPPESAERVDAVEPDMIGFPDGAPGITPEAPVEPGGPGPGPGPVTA